MIIILFCGPAIKHIHPTFEYKIDRMRICLSFEHVVLACFICLEQQLVIRILFIYCFRESLLNKSYSVYPLMLTRNPEQALYIDLECPWFNKLPCCGVQALTMDTIVALPTVSVPPQ